MTSEEKTLQLLAHYRANLEDYAKACLIIRDKEGGVIPFPGFNAAQQILHARLEAQKVRTGRVRAIILKGRQQGCSSYIAARFYHRATLFRGTNVYIMAHEQSASDSLFKIVDRFQVNNALRPHVGTSNVKELEFDKLDSSYVVATAGQKAGGRGRTISLYHASETAFWQSAQEHFAASIQAVPDMPGTEIIVESTASGASGEYYEKVQDARNGVGDYEFIFIPWGLQKEYSRPAPPDFELSSEPGDNGVSEKEYAKLFGLDNDQMAWRRAKVAELRSVQLFDQEYPASPEMAFATADSKRSFILPISVLRARKRKGVEGVGPLIVGADPSGPGKDRYAVCARQGPKVLWVDHRQMPETPEAVLWMRDLIDTHHPDRMFIDLGNIGHAIFTTLKALGSPYTEIIRGVNFGAPSQFKMARPKVPGPKNRRAEMWDRAREWLNLEEGVQVPDNDMLQADLTAPRVKPQVNNDFLLESKKEMKARGLRSPDLGDAFILTFAEAERILTSENRRSATPRKPKAPRTEHEKKAEAFFASERAAGSNSWMGV